MDIIPGIQSISRRRWENLRPGMIILEGIQINGAALPELADYPVLTAALLDLLDRKYRFLRSRAFTVAELEPGCDLRACSESVKGAIVSYQRLLAFRNWYFEEKRKLARESEPAVPIIATGAVERDRLILDRYSSFTSPIKTIGPDDGLYGGDAPTFLDPRDTLKLSISDILSGRLREKFTIPEDRKVALHLVVDYSYSMDNQGKFDVVLSALHCFHNYIAEFLLNTSIRLYVFSESCVPARYPLSGNEVVRKDTNYASFIKKILHNRDPDRHNKVILFSDGMPSDLPEALSMAEKLRRGRIDYTQIIFYFENDLRLEAAGEDLAVRDGFAVGGEGADIRVVPEDRMESKKRELFDSVTRVAETAGGNQVILLVNELAALVSVECYDRYLGLLTLAGPREMQAFGESGGKGGIRDWRPGK